MYTCSADLGLLYERVLGLQHNADNERSIISGFLWHITFFLSSTGDSGKVTTVVATPGQGPDRPQEVSYTDIKVIGNGSFGVVYQARLIDSQEMVAIKKVLQDKRFKVR